MAEARPFTLEDAYLGEGEATVLLRPPHPPRRSVMDPKAQSSASSSSAGPPDQFRRPRSRASSSADGRPVRRSTARLVRTRDLACPGPDREVHCACSSRRPEPAPLLLYLHGGGWMQGGLERTAASAQAATWSDCKVLGRPLPSGARAKFPAGLDTAYAAWRWLAATPPRSAPTRPPRDRRRLGRRQPHGRRLPDRGRRGRTGAGRPAPDLSSVDWLGTPSHRELEDASSCRASGALVHGPLPRLGRAGRDVRASPLVPRACAAPHDRHRRLACSTTGASMPSACGPTAGRDLPGVPGARSTPSSPHPASFRRADVPIREAADWLRGVLKARSP